MVDYSDLLIEGIEDLTAEEIDQIADAFIEALPDDREARIEALDGIKLAMLAEVARGLFSLEGFKAFFQFMHITPLHVEGVKWAENIFKALGSTRKLLQEAFRGSGKTTVISRYFMAYYIGHHPWTTNLIVRKNTQKARETAAEIATLIEKDNRWGLIFPNVVPDFERGWGEEKGYFTKQLILDEDGQENYAAWLKKCAETNRPSDPTFIGHGYNSGSMQGSRTNGILLVDDIHDKENTKSDKELADVKFFVKEVLLPIPVPGEGLEVWNFTPWLVNDAYAERLDTGRYVHSKSPVMTEITVAEYEEEIKGHENSKTPPVIFWSREWQLPEDIEAGKAFAYPMAGKAYRLAWPTRWTQEEIARKFQDILNVAFARMYSLDLKATQGLRLKREWLHYYPAEEIDPTWGRIVGIDYASVADKLRHKDRDYFTLAVLALIPGGGAVLEYGIRKHFTLGEALQKAAQVCIDIPTIESIAVEAIGKGEEFYNQFRLTDDLFGKPLPIFPVKSHSNSKGKRFEEYLGPRFQFSRIWVTTDTGQEFVKHFIDEWLTYPNNTYDDCLDAVYMAALMHDPKLRLREQLDGRPGRQGEKDKPKISPIAKGFGRR